MSNRLIYDLKADNLCTYYVLPLIRLSKSSFLNSNFVNSYLTRDRKYVVVEVLDLVFVSSTVYKRHPDYRGLLNRNGHILLVYKIPSKWYQTILQFTEGRFSKMPRDAKRAIKMYSRLKEDDIRILALDRHEALKNMWERELLVHLDDSAELLSKPDGEDNYIEISDVKRRG